MPQVKYIIFLRNKNGEFKLRDDIQAFGYDERLGQYYVHFTKGERFLYYNSSNVDVAEFTKQLEPPFRISRKEDGDVFFNVLGVSVFEGKENKAYRIVFENGTATNYPAEYLSVEEHIDDQRSINVWEYLNEVAKYNVIPVDDDKTVSLADKYHKMEFVAKDSLIESYLNIDKIDKSTIENTAPIFPFGCNRSQYKAVNNALENKLSVIQGPPGTGKTQTILNIMANLLLDGKTMQIVSNNNSAVENIKEKLESNGIDFICAQLGRVSNKIDFVGHQTGNYPEIQGWKLENYQQIYQEAVNLSREMQSLYEYQEKFALCSENLAEYKRQASKFPEKYEAGRHWPINTLEKYFLLVCREMDRRQSLSIWTKFRLRFKHLPYTDDAPDKLQSLLITSKIEILENECKKYAELTKDTDSKNKRLREISMILLKDCLYRKINDQKERAVFSVEDIYIKSREFIQEYPVVLSTTFSATSNINPNYKFDYLIIDEASQVDITSGALALCCANNAVIVGDTKQLPNVVDNHTEEITSAIFLKYGISESYRYSNNSFLSSVCGLYPDIPLTLLKEHYRCDPLIIGFCSKQFYDGELIPMKKNEDELVSISVVKTVKGNHARGTVNLRQVDTITQEILPVLEERYTDIGIIAPYNNQVDAIKNSLSKNGRKYVTATVHKFQGRENDAIILSTVDNQIKEFTDDPHLLNVAVSRAKKHFTLVVSADEQPDSNIGDLIDYIEYYQGKNIKSEISSIFDLLYKDYTKDLLEFNKTHRRVSEYDSENLAYWTIHDIINDEGLNNLGILMHYPLRHLITEASKLSPDQKTYATHSWTHVDFLIYDSVTHKAILAIEIDGTQYHKKGSGQGKRDILKDSILSSINLPILRLSTAESQEKEKILQAITAAIGK